MEIERNISEQANPELAYRFSELGNPELASRFVESRGQDIELSREVMRRVLDMAGCSEDEHERILIDNSGEKITDDKGEPVKVIDYLHEVAVGHKAALFGILGFIRQDGAESDSEGFKAQQDTIRNMVYERTIESV